MFDLVQGIKKAASETKVQRKMINTSGIHEDSRVSIM